MIVILLCKSGCFARQNRLFLPRNVGTFVMQNNGFRNTLIVKLLRNTIANNKSLHFHNLIFIRIIRSFFISFVLSECHFKMCTQIAVISLKRYYCKMGMVLRCFIIKV